MEINSLKLQLVWTAAEEMPSQDLLALSDTALVAALLRQVSAQVLLSGEEVCSLYAYIGAKLPLIRDIADSRRSQRFNRASGASAVSQLDCAG
jgi:hypothetical protein